MIIKVGDLVPWTSDELVASIVKEGPDYALVLLDRNAKIRYANYGALKILGYQLEEVVDLDFRDIFTFDDIAQGVHASELTRAIMGGRAEDERWHRRKSGECFWASGVLSVIKDEAGDIVGFCKVFRDISLRKKTEDEIKVANANLSQFSHTAAHDLQAPLITIATSLQMALRLKNEPLGEEGTRFVNMALNASKRMHELIKDILTLSEIGLKDSQFSNANCNAIFDMAVSHLKPLIQETGAAVTRGNLPDASVIPNEIERVFQNLITNAIKYRSKTSPIFHMEAHNIKNEWIFSATDNGMGIESENFERIFNSFERIKTTEQLPGTGLGLAICKKIIEYHGGRIWVESKKEKGSTFHFSLPGSREPSAK